MSDIFREVEEDVRREKLEKFWKAYGDYILALGALVVVGIAAFELWQRYEASQRDKASLAFVAAQRITDPKAAAQAFADLAKTAPSGYRLLSRMEQADNMLAAGQRDSAIALYKEIAGEDKTGIGDVARLRAAWAEADTASRADLQTLVAPLQSTPVWKPMADEILAYSDYKAHDYPKAAREFEALSNDPTSPQTLKVRTRAMAVFLEQGGEKNFGTVPEAVPAPPNRAQAAQTPSKSAAPSKSAGAKPAGAPKKP